MKKILTTLLAVMLISPIAANAAESRVQNWVDNLISPITTKEKELNSQAEAQQKAYEKQRKERQKAYEKRQKERQKAYEKKQKEREKALKEAQKRRENTNNALQQEASFWKSLFNND